MVASHPARRMPISFLRRIPMSKAEILHLFLSPGHNYFGHHGRPPGEHPIMSVLEIECVAGLGIRGDRFFDYQPDYKGQITFFAGEVLEQLWEELEIPLGSRNPSATRRNVITRGWDPAQWIGRDFTFYGVSFFGVEECRPCHWMNTAFHPKAEGWLKGRGGLRAKILSDGWLRVGKQPSC